MTEQSGFHHIQADDHNIKVSLEYIILLLNQCKILPPHTAYFPNDTFINCIVMQIETGHFSNIVAAERVSNICKFGDVEDEFHFLFKCQHCDEDHRHFYTCP